MVRLFACCMGYVAVFPDYLAMLLSTRTGTNRSNNPDKPAVKFRKEGPVENNQPDHKVIMPDAMAAPHRSAFLPSSTSVSMAVPLLRFAVAIVPLKESIKTTMTMVTIGAVSQIAIYPRTTEPTMIVISSLGIESIFSLLAFKFLLSISLSLVGLAIYFNSQTNR